MRRTPQPPDSASADTVVADVATDAEAAPAVESQLMSSMEGELSSEAGLMSRTGSMMCEAAGPVLEGVGAFFALKQANEDFKSGDDVGGTLDVAMAIPGVNIVATAPSMTWQYAKAGGAVINQQANCGILEGHHEVGDVDATDPALDRCWGWLSDQAKQDISSARQGQGLDF